VNGLPEGWTRVPLGQVASVSSGIGFPLHLQGEKSGDLGFFKVADISRAVLEQNNELRGANHHVSLATAKTLKGKVISPGSTVFAKIGEAIRLNRRGFVTQPCLVDNNVMAVKAGPELDDRYVFLFLRTLDLSELARSTTVPSLRKGDIETLSIPLPPLPEQKRIADKLDTLLARVDACRTHLARIPAILKRFRQSVLAAATSGELTRHWREPPKAIGNSGETEHSETGLPSTWVIAKGADVVEPGADIVYGIVQPGPKLSEGIPYVRGMDIERGQILVAQLLRTSPAIASRYSRSALKGGDVLLGIIRATKVAVVPKCLDGANITQGTARFRPSAVIQTSYLAVALEAPTTQRWLHAHYRGIDMPGLNLADVRQVPIPLPPIDEQAEIVRRVESLFALADQLEARYTTARAHLDRLTPALLAKAFRGELVPQDAGEAA
jgi:type I restriction enzyme, S subunit